LRLEDELIYAMVSAKRRFWARAIDSVICIGPFAYHQDFYNRHELVLIAVTFFVYEMVCFVLFTRTLGKMMVQIRVVDNPESEISRIRANITGSVPFSLRVAVRSLIWPTTVELVLSGPEPFAWLASVLIIVNGWTIVHRDPSSSLHDWAAGTRVIWDPGIYYRQLRDGQR
jgi:uncharacterized RDD family membrane protein YckC